jgi:hypothetical protein
MTDDDGLRVELSDRDLAEAGRLGVTPEAMLGAKVIETARTAQELGMTVPQFVAWQRTVDEALAHRTGVSLAEWQASREARGRPSGR